MGYISIHSMKVTKDADGNVSKKSVRSKHENEELVKQLTSPSKNSRLEVCKNNHFPLPSFDCFYRSMILLFVAQKG